MAAIGNRYWQQRSGRGYNRQISKPLATTTVYVTAKISRKAIRSLFAFMPQVVASRGSLSSICVRVHKMNMQRPALFLAPRGFFILQGRKVAPGKDGESQHPEVCR